MTDARPTWIAATVSMSFMYWYHAHGGSLPAATRASAHFRSTAKHLSIRLSMTRTVQISCQPQDQR
jgi:hypothetical protein